MSARTNVARVAGAAPPQDGAGDNALSAATLIVAKARAECMELGLTPRQFAELMLPEALLAMMVDGMTREEVEAAFAEFARDHIGPWFFREKRVTGFCDCAREAQASHADDCAIHHIRRPDTASPDCHSAPVASQRTSNTNKALERPETSNDGPIGTKHATGGSK